MSGDPPRTTAATGSSTGSSGDPSSEITARSAHFPGAREPISASSPSTRAPPSVASSRAFAAVSASGRCSRARAPTIAARSSSKRSNEGVEAGLSVAIPSGMPASRKSASGATPQPRKPFERGQCATPTPCAARSSISSASRWTPWAAESVGPRSPAWARRRTPVSPGGGTRNSASGVQSPAPSTSQGRSAGLSAKWVCIGSPSAAAAS